MHHYPRNRHQFQHNLAPVAASSNSTLSSSLSLFSIHSDTNLTALRQITFETLQLTGYLSTKIATAGRQSRDRA
jgi:hypothetical protein